MHRLRFARVGHMLFPSFDVWRDAIKMLKISRSVCFVLLNQVMQLAAFRLTNGGMPKYSSMNARLSYASGVKNRIFYIPL